VKTPVRIAAFLAATLLPLAACGSSDGDPAEAASTPTSSPSESAADTEESKDAGDVAPLPFNASGLLGGNAQPDFPDGEQGKVSVVQVGPLNTDQGILLFAFRNNTSEGISHVDWSATARSGGKIVSTGSSQGTIPAQVQSGEVGLGYIFFENSDAIPDDAEYEFTVETSPADTESYNTAPLKVTEANLSGDAIVGSATNQTGASTDGPFSVSIYCFEGDNLLRYTGDYAEQDGPIADGGTVTFTADLYGEKCGSFAVGVGGYFS
jgi:hypothetical protein